MDQNEREKEKAKYELAPPEGGWGYIVTLAVSLTFVVTVVPVTCFGMLYGGFLSDLGDETSGTSLANGIYNTFQSFTGLAANQLLQRYSPRKVGMLGALFALIGSFGKIFITNLTHLIITFSVFEGIGVGLSAPACLTSFNTYFFKRRTVMMNIAHALVVIMMIAWPALTNLSLYNYGFRGTVALISAFSLHLFVAMGVLQPVKWHMRKKKISLAEVEELQPKVEDNRTDSEEAPKTSIDDTITKSRSNSLSRSLSRIVSTKKIDSEISVIKDKDKHKEPNIWQKISKSLDLLLFEEAKFVNITIGLSLTVTSSVAFLSLLPMLLQNAGLSNEERTWIMTIHFSADLVGRIFMCVVTALVDLRNRYLFLTGTLLTAFFRTAFLLNDSFIYLACVTAALGFLRCLIFSPLSLVIAESYSDRFVTAYTLYMVICGVISLLFSPLPGFIKTTTGSDEAVVHLLTAVLLGCGIPWLMEVVYIKLTTKEEKKVKTQQVDK